MESIYQDAVNIYTATNSVKSVSKELGISEHKARKILVSMGINLTSKVASQIMALYKNGYSENEIADIMNLSVKYINSYLPYSRGIYNSENLSDNAKRIKKCRQKS